MLVLAHASDEIVVTFDGASETVTMTAETLAMLAPIDADGDGELTQRDLDARADALRVGVWEQAKLEPCERSGETASLEPGYVALRARFRCPASELTQEFRWLMVLPPTYRVVFGNQVAKGDLRTLHVTGAARETNRLVGFTLPPLYLLALIPPALLGFWWLLRRRLK